MKVESFNKQTGEVIMRIDRRQPGLWRAIVTALFYRFLDKHFVADCGYGCSWVYPYGFVPECGCPIHDKYEIESSDSERQML